MCICLKLKQKIYEPMGLLYVGKNGNGKLHVSVVQIKADHKLYDHGKETNRFEPFKIQI